MVFKRRTEANLERGQDSGCLQCTRRSPQRQAAAEGKLVSGLVEECWTAHRQGSPEDAHKLNRPSIIPVSSPAIRKLQPNNILRQHLDIKQKEIQGLLFIIYGPVYSLY